MTWGDPPTDLRSDTTSTYQVSSTYLWPPNWHWLKSTRELQEDHYGVNFREMDGEVRADYVTWNATALTAELGEFLNEVGWKPWAKGRGWVNREEAVGELVDVAHFLGNLLCALGVSDEEWEKRYQDKQQVNRDRMESGTYDGRSTKCGCGRALDDLRATTAQVPIKQRDGSVEPELRDGKQCVCGKFHEDP